LHNHTLNAHTHGLAGHTHVTDIDHDHASFNTSSSGSHSHNGLSGSGFGTLGFTATMASGTGITGLAIGAGYTSITIANTDSNHVHPINVPALGVDDITTKSQSGGTVTNSLSTPNTGDKPAFNVTDKEATNTVNTGTGTDNYHPYLAVYKIIKL
jgi:hypothetical protein